MRSNGPTRLIMLSLVIACDRSASAVDLYVALDGRVEWSGKLAETNADRSDGPLPSIEAARDRIRSSRADGKWLDQAINVNVREGTYFLEDTIVFGPGDSGTKDKPVVYAAYKDEKPVVSGGRLISGWQEARVNGHPCWAVDIPEVKQGKWGFRQLFVNGQRRHRPRVPQQGFYHLIGVVAETQEEKDSTMHDEVYFRPGDVRNWRNLNDIEFVSMETWDESHVFLKSVDEAANKVKFHIPSWFGTADSPRKNKHFGRYYLKNVFEALDSPGQWNLDRPTGTLYYLPLLGEAPDNTQVIAPRLDYLVRMGGSADGSETVHDIGLQGLTFCHNDWWLPAGERQGGQAARGIPGAVVLQNTLNCRLTDCTVTHVSSYAIELRGGCRGNLISGCTLTDLGAGGVKVGHDSNNATVTDNEISNGGLVHHGAVGIWVGDSWDNTVSHNHVHHLNYSGISVGWVWGYRPSKAVRNIVEYNHVHHIGQGMLSDLGGIYTLGISPGTVIRYNLVHDVESYQAAGRGLYNDEGSSQILIENNVVYHTSQSAYHLNYGRDNSIRNNIFVCTGDETISRGGPADQMSFTFEHNIVCFTLPRLFDGEWIWKKGNFRMDHNLYWREGGQPFDFPGDRTFEQWQQWGGQDARSIIADPLFVDPENDDFRLKADSPAEKIGFRPIDTSKIGRLKKGARS